MEDYLTYERLWSVGSLGIRYATPGRVTEQNETVRFFKALPNTNGGGAFSMGAPTAGTPGATIGNALESVPAVFFQVFFPMFLSSRGPPL